MPSPAPIARTFTFDGRDWHLVFNFSVIAEFEETTGVSIIDVISPPGGGRPMISRLARLLMFGLRPAHPEITLDEAGRMMVDPEVQALFTEQAAAAMPQTGDTGEDGDTPPANPPKGKARGGRAAGKTG